ncbi:hypothetical protein Htur_2607 [Haloterrigena turkmenica DSM 5511]|uniref:Uncharacterized protein n=1 Tax=Haloterrigena turkmenica (strain ATCC 51198 / DSM 5511 / JCM 9101 / NCIMB 13204 / VKM B-1734 / 4k) TaxID=543526 RepID=D2RW55_HALTV|nr:hypothetical protein [Haloterrigena turkmenica]ADB61484.1 hypothetical protein Htur_2607 [Haloterrigena turkmenica DSM 5511]
MALALVSTEFLTAMGLMVVLVGVPLFVLGVIALVTGYIQYDAERYLEELESAEVAEDGELADDHR